MTPQELFSARDRGEKIEVKWQGNDHWIEWRGQAWDYRAEFRVVKPEPKLVPHWPAVVLRKNEKQYFATQSIYQSIEMAKRFWPDALRLATEYPPIMLEVKE